MPPKEETNPLIPALLTLTRSTPWTLHHTIPLRFPTFHPQGIVLTPSYIFLSSVEILEASVKYHSSTLSSSEPTGKRYDRTTGKGRAHLFVVTYEGELVRDVVLGGEGEEGDASIYHPGGIDTDGTYIYVPVSEYRPHSRGVVYRVDIASLKVEEIGRVGEHVGGVLVVEGGLVGFTWGSRSFLAWELQKEEGGGGVWLKEIENEWGNNSLWIDYQDGKGLGSGMGVLGGVSDFIYPSPSPPIENEAEGQRIELGGLAVVNFRSKRVVNEVPVFLWSGKGNGNRHSVLRNPMEVEFVGDEGENNGRGRGRGDRLRLWVAPGDGSEEGGTEVLVFEAGVGG